MPDQDEKDQPSENEWDRYLASNMLTPEEKERLRENKRALAEKLRKIREKTENKP
ncbi:MAG: hypothetical protein H0T77_05155 [Pyrinomonadaceae bacterium]|nr:hypothetical protein [Pyrinomonadaceae bacterium]